MQVKKKSTFIALIEEVAKKLDLSVVLPYKNQESVVIWLRAYYNRDKRNWESISGAEVATVHLKEGGKVVVVPSNKRPFMNKRNLNILEPDFVDKLVKCLKACIKKRHLEYSKKLIADLRESVEKAEKAEEYLREVLKREV
jgi:hypothetical protein